MREPLEELRSYADSIRSAVPPARSHVVAMRAVTAARRTRPRRVTRTLAISLAVFLIANVAAAGISSSSLPGDFLYPLHRGYEALADSVGLGSGDRTPERVEEARALVERDRPDVALDHLASSLNDPGLRQAAAQIRALDLPREELRDDVANLVEAASAVSEAARSEDPEALRAAVAEIRELAERIAAAARERRNQSDSPVEPPRGRPDGASNTDRGRPDGVGGGRP